MPLGPSDDVTEDADIDEDFKKMLDPALVHQRQRRACATLSGVKLALSGSGKSHTLTAVVGVAERIRWPDELSGHTGKAPINRPSCNMSKLAMLAEANNKILRSIRLKLARKTSQADNLDDVINRLWLGSDPKINHIRLQAQPYCKHCSEYGH